jgi:hypothetical protein
MPDDGIGRVLQPLDQSFSLEISLRDDIFAEVVVPISVVLPGGKRLMTSAEDPASSTQKH